MDVARSATGQCVCLAANTSWYIYNFRARLIQILRDHGYEVCALAPHDEYAPRLIALGAKHVHLELDNTGTNPLRELVCLARVLTTLRRLSPQVVLTYTPKINIYVSLCARALGVPTLANVSGLGRGFTAGALIRFISGALYKIALRHPGTVFFQNQQDLTEFVRRNLVDSKRVERIPGSGVDVQRFRPLPRGESQQRDFVFLLASRMLWEKGIAEYVQAARLVKAKHPKTEFQLLGFLETGNQSAVPLTYIQQCQEQNLVRYMGVTDCIEQFYANVDCVVLPSYYREGVPRSLLEAASCAVPIITTDMPGCRDTVDDGINGFLCRPRDPHDLAEQMLRMMALSQSGRDAMGRAGRAKMIKEFDERIVIARVLSAMERALHR